MRDAPLVIVNPAAGNGRAGRQLGWVRGRLEARPGARLEVSRRPGDAERWAAEAAGRHDRIVAVGGDGTVQEVVNGLLGANVPASIGIVPVGSGNDLARSLNLPADGPGAWKVAVGHGTARIDVARATAGDGRVRWFASAGGIGLDGEVARAMVHRRGWQRSRAGYLATALVHLWRYANRPVRIRLDDGEAMERTILLVAVTNGAFYGGGMHVAPGARVDDALMDLCIVGDLGRAAALRQIPNLYRGRHVDHPRIEMRRARRVQVEGGADTLVHLDGEPFGGLPLQVEMCAGVLTVAVPSGGVGSPP